MTLFQILIMVCIVLTHSMKGSQDMNGFSSLLLSKHLNVHIKVKQKKQTSEILPLFNIIISGKILVIHAHLTISGL